MEEAQKKRIYDKNVDLIRRFRQGEKSAGEELVELNMALVYSMAGRFSGRGADLSDLVETGTIGLVKAINTFDTERGCAFSTYAVTLIFGEIRRFLRDDGMLKVSREEKRLAVLLGRERERRLNTGEKTDIKSLAASVGVSVEAAVSALFSEAPVRSFEESIFDDDDTGTLGSTISDDEEETRNFERIALRYAIDRLSPESRKLIILRYFRDMSQAETAKALGLSQVKVSREEKKIIAELRMAMK